MAGRRNDEVRASIRSSCTARRKDDRVLPDTCRDQSGGARGFAKSVETREVPYLAGFEVGLELTRALVQARNEKEYGDQLQIVATILGFKVLNDLRAAVLLARVGYAGQAFPLLRSALEHSEVLDYLERNRGLVAEFVEGLGRFQRDLSWLRDELPQTELRRYLYDAFNYLTHANFRAAGIHSYEETAYGVRLVVGPMTARSAQNSPIMFASALLTMPLRVLYRCDPEAPPRHWRNTYEAWEGQVGHLLDDLPATP